MLIFSTHCSTNKDFATIKYSTDGNEEWVARYNNSSVNGNDAPSALTVTDGNYIVVTGYNTNASNNKDVIAIKYSSDGTQLWTYGFDQAAGDDYANAITKDGSNNTYIVGASYKSSGQNFNYFTVKVDSDGDKKWISYYNGPASSTDYANAVT